MDPYNATDEDERRIVQVAAHFNMTPEMLKARIVELQQRTIDMKKLQDHGPLSNDANKPTSPVFGSPNFLGVSVASGSPHFSFTNDPSLCAEPPFTPKVIRYAQKIKSAKLDKFWCYPGTEQDWTDDEREHMYRTKFGLVDCCLLLGVIIQWFPFIDDPAAQSEGCKARWSVYLSEIERDLDMIATYFFANGDYKLKYPDYFEVTDRMRRRDLIWSLAEKHTLKNSRSLCYDAESKSMEDFSKDAFAYTRVYLFKVLKSLNMAKMMMFGVERTDLMSELSKDEMLRSFESLRKYLQYLKKFLLLPEEIEAARKTYSSAKDMRFSSREEIIQNYRTQLSNSWVDRPIIVKNENNENGIHLHCKEIDPSNLPRGFIPCGGGFYEYEYIDPIDKELCRVPANCVPYIDRGEDFSQYSAIATCHNEGCHDLEHHSLINQNEFVQLSVAYCGGPGNCDHLEPCVMPGRLAAM